MKKPLIITLLCALTSLTYGEQPCFNLAHYTENSTGLYTEGALLIWKPTEEGLSYAIKNDTSTNSVSDGEVKDPDQGWDVGGKFGMGYQVPDVWMDLFLNWTHFKTDSRDTTRVKDIQTGAVFSVWTNPITQLAGEETGKATWDVSLNLLDFEIGGKFKPRPWLLLRTHFGFRAAWIDQNLDIIMRGGISQGPVFTVQKDEIKMDNDYWGVGPRLGIQTLWGLGSGFSLIGNVAFTLLYGEFDLDQNETVTFVDVQPPITYVNIHEEVALGRTNLELIIGVRWDTMLDNDRYHLAFQLGWEQTYFFGQNQLRYFTDDTNPANSTTHNGDLSLQGVTLTARFDF